MTFFNLFLYIVNIYLHTLLIHFSWQHNFWLFALLKEQHIMGWIQNTLTLMLILAGFHWGKILFLINKQQGKQFAYPGYPLQNLQGLAANVSSLHNIPLFPTEN